MCDQVGARWLAREMHDLGADDTNASGVSGRGGGPTKQDVEPPPGFTFFDCIRADRYTESVTALADLGFKIKEGR